MRRLVRIFSGSGILNLLGMTVAFASLYILLIQVYHDLGYNKEIKDSDKVFLMVVPSWFTQGYYQAGVNRPLGEALANGSSMVEEYGVTRINLSNKNSVYVGEGDNRKEFLIGVSQLTRGALDVFSFTPVTGTFDGMDKEETVAISEKAAKLMGVGIGDAIMLSGRDVPVTVVAVYENMPVNSDLGNIDAVICNQLETEDLGNWSEWGYDIYVKLASKEDKEAFERGAVKIAEKVVRGDFLKGALEENNIDEQQVKEYVNKCTVSLIPFSELYFSKNLDDHPGRIGNYTTTLTLLVVAILIIVITLINFVNFFFAQVPMRIRGVNTRKILGSSRLALVWSFMFESGILVAVSLCAAVVVIMLFMSSTYANLISCSLAFYNNIPVALIAIGTALIMTVASSVYPALYITSFPPALAIKGCFGVGSNGKTFRYGLIALQFIISISFVICAIGIKQQHSFMMNYDMGFNKEHLFTVDIPVGNYDTRESLSDELRKSPHIADVAWGAGLLVNSNRMSWGRPVNDTIINFDSYPVSWNFLKFMGIEIVEGRDFTALDEVCENGVFIFNSVARSKFGLTLDDKISGHNGTPTDIAGFCEDFMYKPLQYSLKPFALYVFGKEPWWQPTHVYIRSAVGASISDVNQAVKEVVLKFAPNYQVEELEVSFFDMELGYQYNREKNLITMVTLFTIIAIIISLMGVLGLVIFETQYRRKEIALRRINGATVQEILIMFCSRFVKIVLVCFAVAAPMSWLIVNNYYSTFAYRSPIYWWVFVVAFLVVLVITVGVVIFRSWSAATADPVDALKTE